MVNHDEIIRSGWVFPDIPNDIVNTGGGLKEKIILSKNSLEHLLLFIKHFNVHIKTIGVERKYQDDHAGLQAAFTLRSFENALRDQKSVQFSFLPGWSEEENRYRFEAPGVGNDDYEELYTIQIGLSLTDLQPRRFEVTAQVLSVDTMSTSNRRGSRVNFNGGAYLTGNKR